MLIHMTSLLSIYFQASLLFAFCRRLLRRDEGRLVRPLSLGRQSCEMATLARLPIDEGAVLSDSVVPDDDRLLIPLDAGLEVSAVREVIVEELEDGVGLLLLEADDLARELRVDVERLLARSRVRADNGMAVDDGLAPLDAVADSGGVDLLDARVGGPEAVQTLLEERAEALVGRDGIDEERVAARLRLVQDVQEGGAGGLLLVGNVRVPGDARRARREEGLVRLVALAAVHQVNLGMALGSARRGVDVLAAKVRAVLQRVGDRQVRKVLVAEGNDLALGHVQRQLVLAGVGQRRQLDALDLAADGGRQVGARDALGEQVGERGIGILAVLGVSEGLQGRVDDGLVPGGEVVCVLSKLEQGV